MSSRCVDSVCVMSHISWALLHFIMTETLNYLPDIRQLHSSTIPHLGSWYWAECSSQLFLHNSSQKTHSDICWEAVSVIKINSPWALSTNKQCCVVSLYEISGILIQFSAWSDSDKDRRVLLIRLAFFTHFLKCLAMLAYHTKSSSNVNQINYTV